MFGRNSGWLLIVAIVIIALLIIGWIAIRNNQATLQSPTPPPIITAPSASPGESPSPIESPAISPTSSLSPSPAAATPGSGLPY